MAYLILAHQSPQILKKLVYALDDPRFDIYIHIDAKKRVSSFGFDEYNLRYSKLTVILERINIGWGEISMVDAMIKLYRYALRSGDYIRFITLSGEDYPVKSNDVIYDTLAHKTVEFIRTPAANNPRHFSDFWFGQRYSKRLCGVLRRVLRVLGISQSPSICIDGKQWIMCKSSQWHALSRGCIQHVLQVYDQKPAIRAYFKYTHAPDETVIPTIIRNTPEYRDCVFPTIDEKNRDFNDRPVLHYVVWKPILGSTVEIFDESAFERIVSSEKLFIRKVRSGISDKLIEMLDEVRTLPHL